MKSILVLADTGPAAEQRLQAALDVVRLTGGHLTLLLNSPIEPFVSMDPFGGSYAIEGVLAEARSREEALVRAFSDRLTREAVPFDVRTTVGPASIQLIEAAALSDLIILSLRDPGDRDTALLVGDVAVAAPCPVLALPESCKPGFLNGTAMVAWSGQAEAANALRAAIPLLTHAGTVKLVSIADDSESFPSTEAVEYLSRQGIHAELIQRGRGGIRVEEALELTAIDIGADWVVMGAYGHSRAREMIFGGVTHHFLKSARFPLLLDH